MNREPAARTGARTDGSLLGTVITAAAGERVRGAPTREPTRVALWYVGLHFTEDKPGGADDPDEAGE